MGRTASIGVRSIEPCAGSPLKCQRGSALVRQGRTVGAFGGIGLERRNYAVSSGEPAIGSGSYPRFGLGCPHIGFGSCGYRCGSPTNRPHLFGEDQRTISSDDDRGKVGSGTKNFRTANCRATNREQGPRHRVPSRTKGVVDCRHLSGTACGMAHRQAS